MSQLFLVITGVVCSGKHSHLCRDTPASVGRGFGNDHCSSRPQIPAGTIPRAASQSSWGDSAEGSELMAQHTQNCPGMHRAPHTHTHSWPGVHRAHGTTHTHTPAQVCTELRTPHTHTHLPRCAQSLCPHSTGNLHLEEVSWAWRLCVPAADNEALLCPQAAF